MEEEEEEEEEEKKEEESGSWLLVGRVGNSGNAELPRTGCSSSMACICRPCVCVRLCVCLEPVYTCVHLWDVR